MDIRVTIDANIVASGTAEDRSDAAPVRLMLAWQRGVFTLVFSDHLYGETERTFLSRYFVRNVREQRRIDMLAALRAGANFVEPDATVQGVASHPEDDRVLGTAVAGGAQYLVTGDHRLLALKQYHGVIILSANAFLAMLPGLLPIDEG